MFPGFGHSQLAGEAQTPRPQDLEACLNDVRRETERAGILVLNLPSPFYLTLHGETQTKEYSSQMGTNDRVTHEFTKVQLGETIEWIRRSYKGVRV